jgi:hypothetical protein|tara:strand:+ start:895 stop:1464 length:570 start_codon:yes stop_codon:yes gene_type:complete
MMVNLDILQIAEENFLITFGVVFGVGLLQGAILARGIRKRFPKLKKYAKAISIILLILFAINASGNISKFADPSKVEMSGFEIPQTPEGAFTMIVDLLGLNAGVLAVVGIFITISLILIFKFADIPPIARYFIFTISVIVLIVSLLGKFTDYVPTVFQIILYSIYQLGLTIGMFLVMRRKVNDQLEELE